MIKRWWKYLLVVFFIVAGILGIGFFWLVQNQEKIVQKILTEVNSQQPGKYEISGSHISLFKAFPYVSIDLEGLAFYAHEAETKSPIYQFSDVYIGFKANELLKGKLDVKKVIVEGGFLDIVHHSDGTWNILNAKASMQQQNMSDTTQNNSLTIHLEELVLRNIQLKKIDLMNKQFAQFSIEEIVAGFILDNDSLRSHLEASLFLDTLRMQENTLFEQKHLDLRFDLAYNLEKQFLHLYKSNFEVEEALFAMEGDIDVGNHMDMNLFISGRKPDFKLLFSLAPNDIYQKLQEYQNEGEVFFNGRIKGQALNGKTPRIDLEFGCENAWFIQTEREERLDGLNFKGYYTNGEQQNLETSEFYIENLKGQPGKGIFAGFFKMKNFLNPELKMNLKADIDLKDLDEFLDLEGFPEVSGNFRIDAIIDDVFDFNNPNTLIRKLKDTLYTQIEMKDLNFKLEAFPAPFEQVNGKLFWDGGTLTLDNFSGKLPKSDWALNGEITNLAALLHNDNQPIRASIKLKSKRLTFAELLSFDTLLAEQQDEVINDLNVVAQFNTTVAHLRNFEHIPHGEFFIDTLSMRMKNYAHAIQNVHVDLLVDSSKLILKDFSGLIDKSDFHFTAEVENYNALFASEPSIEKVPMHLDFHADLLIFEELFAYKGNNPLPEEYRKETLKDFDVKLDVATSKAALLDTTHLPDFSIALAELNGKFTFHKLPLRNFKGNIVAESGTLAINKLRGEIGKTDFEIDGNFNNLLGEKEGGIQGNFNYKGNILDVDEIIIYQEKQIEQAATQGTSYHDSTTNVFTIPFPELSFEVDVNQINYHKYQLYNVVGNGNLTSNHYIYLDTLSLSAAEGNIGLKGYFNGSNPDSIYAKSDLYLEGVSLDKIAYKMDNFGTDYAFNETLHGKVYGKISSTARLHSDFTPYLEGSEAHIEMTLKDGRLENFPPMEMMAEYFGEQNVKNIKFGELSNVMDFKDNQLSIPKMEISSTLGFINLSGKQSMDLDMDYYIQVPLKLVGKAVKNTLFGVKNDGEANQIIADDGKNRMFLNVRVKGTPDKYDIELKKDKQKD